MPPLSVYVALSGSESWLDFEVETGPVALKRRVAIKYQIFKTA